MALYGIVFLGGMPFGAPLAGWVGDHLGPRMGIVLGGVIAIATGLAGLWVLTRARTGRPTGAAQPVPVEFATG